MSDNESKYLLPHGFQDRLPPEALTIATYENALLSHFGQYGYERADPPLIEYEHGLLLKAGSGDNSTSLSKQTFRLMDPISQQMMSLRADMTGQIGRIADSRMEKSPRPLRLCYSGKVLRVRGNSLQSLRQLTQIGCEVFGSDQEILDAEIISLALSGIFAAGLDHAGLDLTLPQLVPAIIEEMEIDAALKQEIRQALAQKDEAGFQGLIKGQERERAKTLSLLLSASGPALEGFQKLKKANLNPKLRAWCDPIELIYDLVHSLLGAEDWGKTVFTLDFTDHRGFEYHQGIAFQIFAKGLKNELGRGGRYVTADKGEIATGFSLYLEELIRILPSLPAKNRMLISYDLNLDQCKEYTKKGYMLVRAHSHLLKSKQEYFEFAKAQNCSHILTQNMEILTLS